MNDDIKKGKLGMGLGTLLGMQNFNQQKQKEGVDLFDLDLIARNENQPRKDFNPEEIMNLAESIKQNGVLQPIILRKIENSEKFMIIAGERRFRAAKLAGLSKIPAIVKDLSEESVNIFAIIENIQRSDLDVIEEADAYLVLKEKFGLNQNEIAHKVSKHRSHIANMLRIAESGNGIKTFARENKISYGMLKLVCGRDDALDLLKLAVEKSLSVRGLESYIKSKKTFELEGGKNENKAKDAKPKNKEFLQKILETEMLIKGRSKFDIELKIDAKPCDKVKILVSNEDHLEQILKIFNI